jgi:hypothetical protein
MSNLHLSSIVVDLLFRIELKNAITLKPTNIIVNTHTWSQYITAHLHHMISYNIYQLDLFVEIASYLRQYLSWALNNT